ncbi:hypothetical protein BaRGS_00005236 [Batillaria attramentaria]|uniref:Uncharacterized protein n=1 Tax=Batillaria attramentaria TaxID=370345 RepID=A0ABD0LXJ9_9CAEN
MAERRSKKEKEIVNEFEGHLRGQGKPTMSYTARDASPGSTCTVKESPCLASYAQVRYASVVGHGTISFVNYRSGREVSTKTILSEASLLLVPKAPTVFFTLVFAGAKPHRPLSKELVAIGSETCLAACLLALIHYTCCRIPQVRASATWSGNGWRWSLERAHYAAGVVCTRDGMN